MSISFLEGCQMSCQNLAFLAFRLSDSEQVSDHVSTLAKEEEDWEGSGDVVFAAVLVVVVLADENSFARLDGHQGCQKAWKFIRNFFVVLKRNFGLNWPGFMTASRSARAVMRNLLPFITVPGTRPRQASCSQWFHFHLQCLKFHSSSSCREKCLFGSKKEQQNFQYNIWNVLGVLSPHKVGFQRKEAEHGVQLTNIAGRGNKLSICSFWLLPVLRNLVLWLPATPWMQRSVPEAWIAGEIGTSLFHVPPDFTPDYFSWFQSGNPHKIEALFRWSSYLEKRAQGKGSLKQKLFVLFVSSKQFDRLSQLLSLITHSGRNFNEEKFSASTGFLVKIARPAMLCISHYGQQFRRRWVLKSRGNFNTSHMPPASSKIALWPDSRHQFICGIQIRKTTSFRGIL